MADLSKILFGTVFAGIGSFAFWTGFQTLKLRRTIKNIPTSKIRSLAMGLVEVHGKVVPAEKELLKSPFTDKDCVYFSFKIEEYKKQGKHSRWVTIRKGTESIPFFVDDGTGKVLVDSKGAQVDIPSDYRFTTGLTKKFPENIEAYMRGKNINLFGLNLGRKRRFTEYYIEPKDDLYIIGTAGDNPHVEEGTGQKNEDDIMIQRGKNEKIYYISDKHEHKVTKSLLWKSLLFIVFGAGFAIIGLVVIFINLGLIS